MSPLLRKLVAVLMLLWMPIFTGSALAASVSMQLPQGGCDEAAMSQAMSSIAMAMGEHHMHHGEKPVPAGKHSTCAVCQLTCTGYLAMPCIEMSAVLTAARENTPFLVAFSSVPSIPLLPPPLVRV
jgi:hypothetical protein